MFKAKTNSIKDSYQLLAQVLKQAREKQGLSRQAAAEKLGVAPKYLDLIEAGRFSDLPAGVYQTLYLKKYIQFLGLSEKVLEKIKFETKGDFVADPFVIKKTEEKKVFLIPRLLKNVLIVSLVFICLFYLHSQFSRAVSAPELIIENPPQNLVTQAHSLEIRGLVEPETEVTVNGQLVLSDSQGKFKQVVNLRSGVNTIVVVAKKKHGAEKMVVRQVLVK